MGGFLNKRQESTNINQWLIYWKWGLGNSFWALSLCVCVLCDVGFANVVLVKSPKAEKTGQSWKLQVEDLKPREWIH